MSIVVNNDPLPSSDVEQLGEQHFDIESLKTQQAELGKQGRLSWVHWLVLCSSIIVTLFAWNMTQSSLLKQEQGRFDREAERVVKLLRERIAHYEDALLSGAAAMQAHEGRMSRHEWRRYADNLRLTTRYPGVNGIGVIHYVDKKNIPIFLKAVRADAPDFFIHPEHSYDLSLPITYIEPEQTNAAALGLDVAFEANRRSAALAARLTGTTQISGPIVLVQDDGKTPGFLFYAPYYDHRYDQGVSWTDQQRKQRFKGLIYAPLVVRKLVEGVLSAENRNVSLSIHDGDTILYEEADHSSASEFSTTVDMQMHGRIWKIDIVSQALAQGVEGVSLPSVVLVSGLCLEAMLFGLFWMMSRANSRTLELAESMTSSLTQQARQLSENNRDLESFAYVASHDLKTPVRNIHTVVDIIDEDYGEYLNSSGDGRDVKNYLQSLKDQATRCQSLITGILDYSRVGMLSDQQKTIDTRSLVEGIGQQLDLSPGQLSVSGSFPTLTTNSTLLEQVFSNLMSNAIKYNPDKELATVAVSASYQPDFYRFAVQDNGPGIEPRFHDRIFQPFVTVNMNPDIQGSGIGLSIVQRALELQGGTISIESAPESGSRFEFTWPADKAGPVQKESVRYG